MAIRRNPRLPFTASIGLLSVRTSVVMRSIPAAVLLGLGDTERATVGSLPRGVGLWKVGATSHVVAHHLGASESTVVDTDAGMNQPPHRQAA